METFSSFMFLDKPNQTKPKQKKQTTKKPQTNRTTNKQKETENEAKPVAVGMYLNYCTT